MNFYSKIKGLLLDKFLTNKSGAIDGEVWYCTDNKEVRFQGDGSPKILIDDTGLQNMANKSISSSTLIGADIETPVRSDVKQDTFANLTTYASSATDGQLMYATDEQKYYGVSGGVITELGGSSGGATLESFEYYQNLNAGDLVKIVNISGPKVMGISGTCTHGILSSDTFGGGSGDSVFMAYDPVRNKVLILYNESTDSNYGTLIAADLSGSTITFGASVRILASSISWGDICFDSNSGKFVAIYSNDNSSYNGEAVVAEVNGLEVTIGTPVAFSPTNTYDKGCSFDSIANKVIISYTCTESSNYHGRSVVGSVSGMSISFGTPVDFFNNTANYISSCFNIQENKTVIIFSDHYNDYRGNVVVGAVSGTTITFGSIGPFPYTTYNYGKCITYEPLKNKVVIFTRDGSHSDIGAAFVCTVTGLTVAFGSKVTIESSKIDAIQAAFNTVEKKIVVSFKLKDSPYAIKTVVCDVNGTSLDLGPKSTISSSSKSYRLVDILYHPKENKTLQSYVSASSPYLPTIVTLDMVTPDSFDGIAQVTASSGTVNPVALIGDKADSISGSGLPGMVAYIQTDGTLGYNETEYIAGTFIDTDRVLVTKNP